MIPKCKQCAFMERKENPTISIRDCKHREVGCKRILGRDSKTSPQWCPLRSK